jgi:glycosyltransferase involved in cell wall biosynthesis
VGQHGSDLGDRFVRFHVVGLPFESSPACAYEGKVVRFVRMMRARGHTVIHYEVLPDEIDPARSFVPGSSSWRAMNDRVIGQIRENAEPTDFICLIAGLCQKPIADAFPTMQAIEFGVGYGGTFADFRVFESHAWMHTVYGAQSGGDAHGIDGRFYDAVIPNYFDVEDFPAGDGDGGYFLFIGRLIERKGAHIAAEVCRRLGVPLIVAGEGDPPDYGTYIGLVGPAERARLMGGARALFVPTLYVEPFGGVAVEAMLCGTPVITTDWGAFTETVVDGVTGFRCRTFAEFLEAAGCADELDRDAIRQRAVERYSLEAVAPMYERYFTRLSALWGAGWYETA